MKKKIFIVLILSIVAAVSALGFIGCGNVPSGNGTTIEKPSDKENPPSDNNKEENGGEGEKEDKDEEKEDKDNEKEEKSDSENAPSYEDPHEDGGWTGWQKDKK